MAWVWETQRNAGLVIWWWYQQAVKAWSGFRNLVAALFKSEMLPEFIVFVASFGGSQGGRSAQHQRVVILVNATWNLMGTFLSYTGKKMSWKLALFRGRICWRGIQRMMPMQRFPGEFSGKDVFAGEQDRGQEKPCCVLFSVRPSSLLCGLPSWLLRPFCWAELLAKSVLSEECHRHWWWWGGLPMAPSCCPASAVSSHWGRALNSALTCTPLVFYHRIGKKREKTIHLDQVWTDKKGCPCELFTELSLASSKNEKTQELM